jgi:hypothetical protein
MIDGSGDADVKYCLEFGHVVMLLVFMLIHYYKTHWVPYSCFHLFQD